MTNRDRCRTLFLRLLTIPLAVAAPLSATGAQAQTTDLSQALITADAVGDGWSIVQQGPDNSININRPEVPPSQGYGGEWKNGPGLLQVYLYGYPTRTITLAAFNSDKQAEWGHFTTQFDPTSGYGDGPAYQPVDLPGKGPGTSGIAFVDGNVIVYVRADGIDNQADADALTAQVAQAQDAALQGSIPSPGTSAAPSATAGGSSAPSAMDVSSLRAFASPVLMPSADLQPFASFGQQAPLPPSLCTLVPAAPCTNYPSSYGAVFTNPNSEGPTAPEAGVFGAIGHQLNDDITSYLAKVYSSCAANAPYCSSTNPTPGCAALDCAAQGEVFRGLKVRGADAVVQHVQAGAWTWTVSWFDAKANASYSLLITGKGNPFDSDTVAAGNKANAQQVSALADNLVSWSGS
jgi:hypothetical protein